MTQQLQAPPSPSAEDEDPVACQDPARPAGVALVPFPVAPHRWLLRWWAVATALLALHYGVHVWHHRVLELPWVWSRLFDLNTEQSFGTWFASVLLLADGLAAWACRRRAASAVERTGWGLLSAGFVILSAEEIAGLHESLNTVTSYSWTVPGGLVAAVAAVVFLPFLWSLPLDTRTRMMVAGLVYLAGALGMEELSLMNENDAWLRSLTYALLTGVEEGLEMAGALLFLRGVVLRPADDSACIVDAAGTR